MKSPLNRKNVVEKIMDFVIGDSDTDSIRRLMKMSQEVHSCKRKDSVSYSDFSERFRGRAQTYLIIFMPRMSYKIVITLL